MLFIIGLIFLVYSLLYYHIIYWLLDIMRVYIDEHYDIIKHPLMLVLFILMVFMMNKIGGFLNNHFAIVVFYSVCIYIMMNMGDNSSYMMLGVSTVFFLSEYWEIPAYIWRLFYTNNFKTMSMISNVYLFVVFISKISTVLYMIKHMRELNINYRGFMRMLYYYSIVYIPLNIVYRQNYSVGEVNWFFRTICYVFILVCIHLNTGEYDI